MSYRLLPLALWDRPELAEQGPEGKLLLLWAWTNRRQDATGAFPASPAVAAAETGLPAAAIDAALAGLTGALVYRGGWWYVPGYYAGQAAATNAANFRRRAAREVATLPPAIRALVLADLPELAEATPQPPPPPAPRTRPDATLDDNLPWTDPPGALLAPDPSPTHPPSIAHASPIHPLSIPYPSPMDAPSIPDASGTHAPPSPDGSPHASARGINSPYPDREELSLGLSSGTSSRALPKGEPSDSSGRGRAPAGAREREEWTTERKHELYRHPLYRALREVFRRDPVSDSDHSLLAKYIGDFARLGATPDEIARRAAVYRTVMPRDYGTGRAALLTVPALFKFWALCDGSDPKEEPHGPDRSAADPDDGRAGVRSRLVRRVTPSPSAGPAAAGGPSARRAG